MRVYLSGALLLAVIHAIIAVPCRRWPAKCSQHSDCCGNRRCNPGGRCSLFAQRPRKVYKCFDNRTELLQGVISYRDSDAKEMRRVKELYGNPIGKWCVGNVTDFTRLFDASVYSNGFNEDISDWNTSAATKMSYLFYDQRIFNQDISKWDVSKVTDISSMFGAAYAFNQDISSWDVSKVTSFGYMFTDAYAFNINLCPWRDHITSSFTSYSMFANSGCPNKNAPSYQGSVIKNLCYDCPVPV
jgi:surface protein